MKTITPTWSEPMKQLPIMILAAIFFVSCTPMTTVAKADGDELRIAQQRLNGAVMMRNATLNEALKKSGMDKEFKSISDERKALEGQVAAKRKALKDEIKSIDVKYKHLGAQQEEIIKQAVSKAKMDKKYKQLDKDVEVALKAVQALQGKK